MGGHIPYRVSAPCDNSQRIDPTHVGGKDENFQLSGRLMRRLNRKQIPILKEFLHPFDHLAQFRVRLHDKILDTEFPAALNILRLSKI